jgi:hypothetical protein
MSLYIDNSNVIELQDLKDVVTDTVDESASVSVTIVDKAGNEVSGENWPVPMAHDTAGTYRATLASSLSLLNNKTYYAVVDVTATGGVVGKWRCPVKALTRACR